MTMIEEPVTKEFVEKVAKRYDCPVYVPNPSDRLEEGWDSGWGLGDGWGSLIVDEEGDWHEVMIVSPTDQAVISTDNEAVGEPQKYLHIDNVLAIGTEGKLPDATGKVHIHPADYDRCAENPDGDRHEINPESDVHQETRDGDKMVVNVHCRHCSQIGSIAISSEEVSW